MLGEPRDVFHRAALFLCSGGTRCPARNASHSDAGGIWDFRGSAAGWVADGTRTRNNQNHNLGLYH